MPTPNLHFDGNTYVAFSDLSGFKIMLEDVRRAAEALDSLYTITYELFGNDRVVKGVAFSDCVVSWIDRGNGQGNAVHLNRLLCHLKALHRRMLRKGYLITSTVAWGEVRYQDRIRLPNFDKQMFYGQQYVRAYLANSKVEPGAIVLLADGCEVNPRENAEIGKLLRKCKEPDGWEYFWSAAKPSEIKPSGNI